VETGFARKQSGNPAVACRKGKDREREVQRGARVEKIGTARRVNQDPPKGKKGMNLCRNLYQGQGDGAPEKASVDVVQVVGRLGNPHRESLAWGEGERT